MSFDAEYYTSTYADVAGSGTSAAVHFLTIGWKEGRYANATEQPLTPAETLQVFAGVGDRMAAVVSSLSATQIAYLGQVEGFDLGATLVAADPGLLADFMAGWGKEELEFVENLPNFDFGTEMRDMGAGKLQEVFGKWSSDNRSDNLRFLSGLDSFDFSIVRGGTGKQGDAEAFMTLLASWDASLQADVYGDFDASDFVWLDQAQDFDLVATLRDNFAFFSKTLSPDQALLLFPGLGTKLNEVAGGLDSNALAFLSAANGFDLGSFLTNQSDEGLAAQMAKWGQDQLFFVDSLPNFDLGKELSGFSSATFAGTLGGWRDINTISYINTLDGFDLGAKLKQLTPQEVGTLLGQWDSTLINKLSDVGGGFDLTQWILGAVGFLPPNFSYGGITA